MWLTLSLLLLESNDVAKAAQVVSLVDDPSDVIAMHADRRYKQLLNAPYFESNAHDAARTRIKVLRHHLEENPRSLAALLLVTQSLLNSREDQEALDITTQADRKIAPLNIRWFGKATQSTILIEQMQRPMFLA
jgi:hypothetical protein